MEQSGRRGMLALGASAVLVLFVLALLRSRGAEETTGALEIDREAPAAEPTETTAALPAAPAGPERRLLAEPAPTQTPAAEDVRPEPPEDTPPEATPTGDTANVRVQGMVLTPGGAPLSAVGVGLDKSQRELARTGPDGHFELELEHLPASLATVDREHATLLACRARRTNATQLLVIVAAPAVDLAGVALDDAGSVLAGVDLSVELDREVLRGFPMATDSTFRRTHTARSGSDGTFKLTRVPAGGGSVLTGSREGYESLSRPVPAESRSDLELVLRPRTAGGKVVLGVVFHEDGSPAHEAQVHLGDASTSTDEAGRFRLEIHGWVGPDLALVATLPGFQPALRAGFGERLQDEEAAPAPVSLFLGGPVLAIRGHVLTDQGAPCERWNVDLVDPTQITRNQIPAIDAESLSARLNSGSDSTEPDGSFLIDGLAAREYTLRAWDPDTFLSFLSPPIFPGGEQVELRVPPDAVVDLLHGRVLAPDGQPIAGVALSLRFVVARSGGATSFQRGPAHLTDAQGRFEMERVPRALVSISVTGEAVVPLDRAVEELDLDRELELVVRRRCHFRVETETVGGDFPDAFALLRADGSREGIHSFRAFGSGTSTRQSLQGGRSAVYTAGEGHFDLVLYRGEAELARRPIDLEVGEVQVIGG